MNSKTEIDVLVSEDVCVNFPLVSSVDRWQLFLGIGIKSWHEALKAVTLRVPHGKIVGVIGHNGAGKSTLLRTLAGVYSPTRGRVVRLGPVSALCELGGMSAGPAMTGLQFVTRWMQWNGVPRKDWATVIDEVRDFSELGERLDDRILTYSSGMAARLYFSTATSLGHEIYLIDEALSVGDEHFQSKCWKRIRDRLGSGASGILVTHDWSAILRLCEQSYELKNGQVVGAGATEKVICDYLKLSDQLSLEPLARFSNACPTSVEAMSSQDWSCDVPVDILAEGSVWFTYSVEKLILGQDWQILFLGDEVLLKSSTSKCIARIEVPELPLPSGNYRLNLFLSGDKPADGGPRPAYDIRSWTTGNSLKLIVHGYRYSGLIIMPLIVEVR